MKVPRPMLLEGRHLRLEPLEARHLPGLIAAGDEDPGIFRFMVTNPYIAGWDEWLAEALAGQAAGRYISWATVLREDAQGREPRVIGSTRYGDIEPAHGRVEIGWTWLAQSQRGTGANTEAKYLQLRHAFEDLGATRVAFKTDARNERAPLRQTDQGGLTRASLALSLSAPQEAHMDRPRYLTTAEVARELRVSNDTVLRLIASGELPALRVSPRIVRIPTPAFAVFQAQRFPARRAVVRRRRPTEVTFGAGEPILELERV